MSETSAPSYLQARQAWENGWYRVAANARNWRWLALLLLLVNLLLCLALWQLANRRSTYIVEVDRHGHALAFGPASELQVPEERLWRYFLSSFIHQLRSVPSDPEVLQGNLATASSYLRGDALETVRSYFSDANPWASQRSSRVSVEVHSVLRKDKTHWQIEWTETHQDRIVAQRREERWQALLTTAVTPPRSSELILRNPLGFYVTHLDWTRLTSKGAL